MTWKRWFRRRSKPDQFMKLICEQAHHTQRGMDVLLEYIREPSEAKAVTIHAIEKDADEVRRILIDELNHSFVTPIDREDLFSLSRTIDDVLDYADTTVDEISLLGITPNSYLVRIGLAAPRRERGDQPRRPAPGRSPDRGQRPRRARQGAREPGRVGLSRGDRRTLPRTARRRPHHGNAQAARDLPASPTPPTAATRPNIIGDIVVKQM